MDLKLDVNDILQRWTEQVANDTMRMIHALRSTMLDDLVNHVDAPAGLVYQIILHLNREDLLNLDSEDGHTYVACTSKGDDYARHQGFAVRF